MRTLAPQGLFALAVGYVLAHFLVLFYSHWYFGGYFWFKVALLTPLLAVPYMFLLSLLYLHNRDRHHLLLTAVTAIVSPVMAWYVLAKLFNITLP